MAQHYPIKINHGVTISDNGNLKDSSLPQKPCPPPLSNTHTHTHIQKIEGRQKEMGACLESHSPYFMCPGLVTSRIQFTEKRSPRQGIVTPPSLSPQSEA